MAGPHRYPLPDGRIIDFDVPTHLRLAIGDAIVAYSRIDNMVLEIIWELRGSDLNEKRKLARRSAAQNFEELQAALASATDEPFESIWETLETLRTERALICHGVWMLIDGRQFVLWHKEFLARRNEVDAESFDDWRFERFMKKADAIYELLYKFRMTLPIEGSPKAEKGR